MAERRPDPIPRPAPIPRPGSSAPIVVSGGKPRKASAPAPAAKPAAKPGAVVRTGPIPAGDLEANRQIQRELQAAGYPLGPHGIDGKVGPDTRAAYEKMMEGRRAGEMAATAAATEKAKADAARAQADAARAQTEAAKVEASKPTWQKTLMEIGAVAVPAAVAFLVGSRLGRGMGLKAAEAAKAAIKSVNALGRDAAAINKGRAVLAGTAKGDKLKAIVNEAYSIGGVKAAFASPGYKAPSVAKTVFQKLGKPPAAGDAVAGVLAVEGAVTTGASYFVDDPDAKRYLRMAGGASLAMAGGLKGSLAVAKAAAPRPAARAITAIESARNRLVREAAKQALGKGQLRMKAATRQVPVRAAVSAKPLPPARPRATGGDTFTRTYRTGPKAGLTETVRKPVR